MILCVANMTKLSPVMHFICLKNIYADILCYKMFRCVNLRSNKIRKIPIFPNFHSLYQLYRPWQIVKCGRYVLEIVNLTNCLHFHKYKISCSREDKNCFLFYNLVTIIAKQSRVGIKGSQFMIQEQFLDPKN